MIKLIKTITIILSLCAVSEVFASNVNELDLTIDKLQYTFNSSDTKFYNTNINNYSTTSKVLLTAIGTYIGAAAGFTIGFVLTAKAFGCEGDSGSVDDGAQLDNGQCAVPVILGLVLGTAAGIGSGVGIYAYLSSTDKSKSLGLAYRF